MDEYFILIDRYIAPTALVFFGALLGYFFTNYLENKRQKNLKVSFYQEINRVNQYLKDYLPTLVIQFNNPKQKTIVGIKPIYFIFLEAIIIELMSTKYSLTSKQLDLIHNLKAKLNHFESTYQDRDEAATKQLLQQNTHFCRLNPSQTVLLILDCIEIIYFLELLCSQKEKFTFTENTFQDQYQKSFKLSGIEYNEATYKRIVNSLEL